ncbi:MAG: hypothetical protein N3J91_16065 [Verrucomicrobiae bacterium]|nr:hypothetical protein [Verrucomicrobiae bacterium]
MCCPKEDSEAAARRARRVLRWVIGAVIAFNVGLLLYLFLPR